MTMAVSMGYSKFHQSPIHPGYIAMMSASTGTEDEGSDEVRPWVPSVDLHDKENPAAERVELNQLIPALNTPEHADSEAAHAPAQSVVSDQAHQEEEGSALLMPTEAGCSSESIPRVLLS